MRKHIPRIAVTVSGGIDSTVLTYSLAHEEQPEEMFLLFCDYGQACRTICWKKVLRTVDKLRMRYPKVRINPSRLHVALPDWCRQGGLFIEDYKPSEISPKDFDYSKQKQSYADELVDGRNAILFLWMLTFCSKWEIPVLYAGHQYEPVEWDNLDSYRHRHEDFGPAFIDRINLLQECGFRNRVRVKAPFLSIRKSKLDIMKLANKLEVDLRMDTYSCQFYPECGRCDNCMNLQRNYEEYSTWVKSQSVTT